MQLIVLLAALVLGASAAPPNDKACLDSVCAIVDFDGKISPVISCAPGVACVTTSWGVPLPPVFGKAGHLAIGTCVGAP
ncbi:hypothetical protein PsYK624_128270 [Phanerochaete sordida]|uniref:Hydrophobin n=1 Tax=Phanerochaete sordida TaxID=48140 RepID=A0A9P3LJW7_9APHY|nr:hypothetical protein PsYK624_128270 [Phanerochaete sordida]